MIESVAKTILLLILGSAGGVERYAAFQFSILRPFPASVILGLIFGRMNEMLVLGIFFEVLWLSKLPVGNTVPPHEVLAFFSAVIIYLVSIRFGIPSSDALSWSIFWGIVNGYLGKRVDMVQREINLRIARWIEAGGEDEELIGRSLYYALSINFVVHFIYLTAVLVFAFPLALFLKSLSLNTSPGLIFLSGIPSILFFSYLSSVKKQRLTSLYILTFLIAFFLFLFIHWLQWIW